jgi:hypothetical protein
VPVNLLKITTFYPEYLSQFYQRYPLASEKPYDEQYSFLMTDKFGWSDFFEKYAGSHQIIANNRTLQEKWIEGLCGNEILEDQIMFYNPGVILFEDVSVLTPALLQFIKDFNPDIKLIGHYCTLGADKKLLKRFDGIISCSGYNQKELEGSRSATVYHGFETSLVKQSIRDIPASFVGSLIQKPGYHTYRYKIITNLQVHGLIHAFTKVYGLEMYDILSRSKITINCEADCSGEYASNMRLFESTGMGAMLITDWKKNLSDLFEIDKEIITYKTPEDCAEKVRYYIEHEEERAHIAEAGQRRTLKDHTFESRVKDIMKVIESWAS